MEQSEIGEISTLVKDCLRCGKCKPVCSTHVPRANLLYSPRNKILAHLAADRGLPLRRADPARHFAEAFRRIQRRRRPLHDLPQVRQALPGRHRFRRCLGRHAQLPAQAGQEDVQSRQGGGDGLPDHEGPGNDQADAQRMMDLGFKAQRLAYRAAKTLGLIQDSRDTAGYARQRRPSRRRSSTSSTNRCPAICRNVPRARCSTSRTTR